MISHLPNCGCQKKKGLAHLVASLHCHSEHERRRDAEQAAQRNSDIAQARKVIEDRFTRFALGVLEDQRRANSPR